MPEIGTNLDDLETWQNIGRSRFVLKKFTAKGDLMGEIINGGRKFHVTTRERHINSEMSANKQMDPFQNGMFAPVQLLDSTDDLEQIASNPNLMGESDMVDLVRGRVDGLRKRLAEVENTVVLDRLQEVAAEQDASISKVEAIKSRIAELSPALYTEISSPTAQ
jgi:hypothetical protein